MTSETTAEQWETDDDGDLWCGDMHVIIAGREKRGYIVGGYGNRVAKLFFIPTPAEARAATMMPCDPIDRADLHAFMAERSRTEGAPVEPRPFQVGDVVRCMTVCNEQHTIVRVEGELLWIDDGSHYTRASHITLVTPAPEKPMQPAKTNGEPPWLDAKRKQLPPKWKMHFEFMDHHGHACVSFEDGAGHSTVAVAENDEAAFNVPWCVDYLVKREGFVVEKPMQRRKGFEFETDIVGETNGIGMPRMPDVTTTDGARKTEPAKLKHDFREGERVVVRLSYGVETEAHVAKVQGVDMLGLWINRKPANVHYSFVRRP